MPGCPIVPNGGIQVEPGTSTNRGKARRYKGETKPKAGRAEALRLHGSKPRGHDISCPYTEG
jgi:hypothetical protein